MITYYVNQSNPTITHTLQDTLRGSGGFGSTGDYEHAPHTLLDTSESATTVQHTQQGSGTYHDTQQHAGPDDYIQQHLATTKEPSTDPSGLLWGYPRSPCTDPYHTAGTPNHRAYPPNRWHRAI